MASGIVEQIELFFKNANELYRRNRHSEVIQELSKIEALMKVSPYPYFHEYTANIFNRLANFYQKLGKIDQAISYYHRTLEIIDALRGKNSEISAFFLTEIGILYQERGSLNEALDYLNLALNIRLNILGINHFHTATSLNDVGLLYQSIMDFNQAIAYFKAALEICRSLKNDPDTASCLNLEAVLLNNLAVLYESMGNYEQALIFFKQALLIREHIWGINDPDTVSELNWLTDLLRLYLLAKRYEEAIPLYSEIIERFKNISGINHPNTANNLITLAALYESIGQHQEAYALMLKYVDIHLKFMVEIFKVSSERQRLTYFQQNYYHFERFISLVFQSLSHSSQAVQSVFEVIQKLKLIVTETTILQKNAVLSGTDPHLKTLFNKYQELTQTIINLTFTTLTKEQQNYRYQLIEEQQKLEAELSRQIPELDLERKLLEIDRRAVALELPENSTLLEFVRFRLFDFTAIPANGDRRWKPARYVAFILPAGQPDNIQMIDLGEAENIDRLIKLFRENINPKKSDGGSRIDEEQLNIGNEGELNIDKLDEIFPNLQQLQQLLFNPIKPHLPADTKKLIIAADGQLNLLPFEVIPINENQYLMDEYTITYLNVGRDLIRLKFPSTTQPTAPLIIANPDYNLSDETAITSQDTSTQTQVKVDIPDTDLRKSQPGGKFAPIPGTALESVEISKYLGVTPQTEKNAVESLVKSQLSPRILHIATHGYFLPVDKLQDKFKENSFKLERLNLTISTLDPFHQAGMQNIQNPLLRAGLAFAGANTALNGGKLPAAAEDGILTAQDVATLLDLRGTELVVLSACESGLGDVNLGESVQGLRHAFIQAGAKSLIVSLWTVSDIATAILMGQFYHYYLEDKLPVGKALEQAKRYVCNLTVGQMRHTWLTKEKIEYVGRYSPKSEDNLRILANDDNDYQPYKHPKYWAAFIYLGLAD